MVLSTGDHSVIQQRANTYQKFLPHMALKSFKDNLPSPLFVHVIKKILSRKISLPTALFSCRSLLGLGDHPQQAAGISSSMGANPCQLWTIQLILARGGFNLHVYNLTYDIYMYSIYVLKHNQLKNSKFRTIKYSCSSFRKIISKSNTTAWTSD